MIKKLKTKFIILSMSSLFVLLTVIVVAMNIVNYTSVVSEADDVLNLLSLNKGAFPDFLGDKFDNRLPKQISPELPYESRYFSALLNDSLAVVHTDTSRIAAIDSATAGEYAQIAVRRLSSHGFVGRFRFIRTSETEGIRITFLDCGRQLDASNRFMYTSIIMSFAGFIIVFFVIFFFAGKMIHPIAESYEKQKRFITDAGHEIKTPLTIINANADVLEMELGKNEWLEDIQRQTKRLAALTNDLVMLSRMEEAEKTLQKIDFPLSEVVEDSAAAFRTLAANGQKQFYCNIQPLITMRGNVKSIEQLVSILMDNALKYSPEGGKISVELYSQSKTAMLCVSNQTETEISKESLSYVFDRFYRADPSRSSQINGHGIGLSVAKAIVTAHGGKITAALPEPHTFKITAFFPL